MKGLTLTEPWASLVAIGAKGIETRDWRTSYTGDVAIHAAKRMDALARELCLGWPFAETLNAAGFGDVDELPRGAVVAVVRLSSVFQFGAETEAKIRARSRRGVMPAHEAEFGDFSAGRYGFVLTHVRPLVRPVSCRGMLSLWAVPADVEREIREQLEAPLGSPVGSPNRYQTATSPETTKGDARQSIAQVEHSL